MKHTRTKKPFKQIPLRLSEDSYNMLVEIQKTTNSGTLSGTVLSMIRKYHSLITENQKISMELSMAKNNHQNLKNLIKNERDIRDKIMDIVYK